MLVKFSESNLNIFNNLVQCYEAEFSAITRKLPNHDGKFDLDTIPDGSIEGWFWFIADLPAGFILIDLGHEPFNVNEFYVLPCYRQNGVGEKFFYSVLERYPGAWQVKQLEGAEKAKNFWRKVINKYTAGNFREEKYNDGYWGVVTRQLFNTK